MWLQARRGLPPDVSLEKMTDFYFSLCSIQASRLPAGNKQGTAMRAGHLLVCCVTDALAPEPCDGCVAGYVQDYVSRCGHPGQWWRLPADE